MQHELEEYTETAAAVWIVQGAWWVILRDQDDTTLMPEGRLVLGPSPSLN